MDIKDSLRFAFYNNLLFIYNQCSHSNDVFFAPNYICDLGDDFKILIMKGPLQITKKGDKMTTIHSWSQIQSQLRNPNNPVVFLDVAVGATEIGRIMIGKFHK